MSAKPLRMAIIGCCVACTQPATAVSLSNEGTGQVLLFPYYTMRAGYDTVLSISNTTQAGKALKLRFREGRNSRIVLDVNLYLGANMSWTGAATSDGGGSPILRTYESTCTAPLPGADPANPAARQYAFTSGAYANHDMAGSSLERAKEGFFEVIEMGEVNGAFVLPSGDSLIDAITYTTDNETFVGASNSVGLNCEAVATAWETAGAFLSSNGQELSPPQGGLHGAAMIINIGDGTTFPFQPVALDAVYSTSRHTSPGSASPNLTDADPNSTVLVGGVATTSSWEQGIDAVSAVLTHNKVLNDYAYSPNSTAVATDLILTFPTKGFYVTRESDAEATRAPFTAKFDDSDQMGSLLADGTSSGACEPLTEARFARSGQWNTVASIFQLPTPHVPAFACWSSTIVSIGNVLSTSNAAPTYSEYTGNAITSSGRIEFTFPSGQKLISTEGRIYMGLPTIGLAVRKYISTISEGILANYGVTHSHKYESVVQ